MAFKSYHHLKAGDTVSIQHYLWGPDGSVSIVEEIEGLVLEVLKSRLAIEFVWRVWEGDLPWDEQRQAKTVQHFSRQGGQRRGAVEDDYRIHPQHATKKDG